MLRGGGGVQTTPKKYDLIYEQPLSADANLNIFHMSGAYVWCIYLVQMSGAYVWCRWGHLDCCFPFPGRSGLDDGLLDWAFTGRSENSLLEGGGWPLHPGREESTALHCTGQVP